MGFIFSNRGKEMTQLLYDHLHRFQDKNVFALPSEEKNMGLWSTMSLLFIGNSPQ
jgi:hypothetical protein